MEVASAGNATRLHEVVKVGNTYTIEKPLTTASIDLEWFTLLSNWQSRVVTDPVLLSNDSLKAMLDKELFVDGNGVKDSGVMTALATADRLVGIGTEDNLIAINAERIAALDLRGATHYTITLSAAVTGFTTTRLTSESSKIAIPADKVLTIDSALDVAGDVANNASIIYIIKVGTVAGDGTLTTSGPGTVEFKVTANKAPNTIELGGEPDEFAGDGTTPQGYRYVNFEMASNGPTNLFPAIPAVKAAIRLAAGKEGIVLVEQTSVANSALQARVRLLDGKDAFLLDETDVLKYVDGNDEDDFGLSRKKLVINNTTVAGTYNLVFKVDTLELPVTIIIKNPTPKIFVMSGLVGADEVSVPTAANYKFDAGSTSKEFLKYLDAAALPDGTSTTTPRFDAFGTEQAVNANDLFAELVDGVYTIEMKSNYAAGTRSGLYARIAVADLALGVYDFKVVKTYPDGRVETTTDKAEVTGLDGNQVALFGATTKVGVNNPKFIEKFIINEAAYVTGQYKFEFTIGTVSKTYIVNVEDAPKLLVKEVKIGTKVGALLSTTYTFEGGTAVTYALSNVTLTFTLQNLSEEYYVSAAIVENNTGDGTAGEGFALNTLISGGSTANSTSKVSLKELETLLLGAIAATVNNNDYDNDDRITIDLFFWKKVDRSVSANLYESIGEAQRIFIGFKAPVAA
jgi:hypothetical protein